MDSLSHLGANRRHSSALARICNNGVGVKTRFHVSIFLGRGTSPIDTRLSRLGVRGVGFSLTFPLATPLIPTTSAGSPLWLHLLFGGFFGTTGLNFGCCDFSPAWATGLRLWALPVPPVPCGSGTEEIS